MELLFGSHRNWLAASAPKVTYLSNKLSSMEARTAPFTGMYLGTWWKL